MYPNALPVAYAHVTLHLLLTGVQNSKFYCL